MAVKWLDDGRIVVGILKDVKVITKGAVKAPAPVEKPVEIVQETTEKPVKKAKKSTKKKK